MSPLLPAVAHLHAWYLSSMSQLERLSTAPARRDARGNNSIEMAIIVGVVIVVAGLIAWAIQNAVKSRLDGMK